MQKKRYFRSFDALRFLAFFKVFLFHLPISNFPLFSYLKAGGGIGVMFFFVLSGFLITHIILEEKEAKARLNLKNFFLRRILRIWPLYYAMILFAFLTPWILGILGLTASEAGYEPNWWMSLGFLENYRMILLGESPNVAPLGVMWSLCIEEHFYLLWGITLYFLPSKKLPYLLFVSILISLLSRFVFFQKGWDSLDLLTNLDLFAVGALPAYLLTEKRDSFRFPRYAAFTSRIMLLFILILVFVYPHFSGQIHFVFGPLLLGITFMWILVLFIPEDASLSISDEALISIWGKYTYGLYVYHTIVIALCLQLWEKFLAGAGGYLESYLFGLLCLSLSILISWLSYLLLEKPFLRLKKYFY